MDERLNERLETIEEIVGQVRECLVGNEFTKNKGLVDDVINMKSRLLQAETFIKNLKFMITVAGVSGGALGYLIQLMTQYLLTKK